MVIILALITVLYFPLKCKCIFVPTGPQLISSFQPNSSLCFWELRPASPTPSNPSVLLLVEISAMFAMPKQPVKCIMLFEFSILQQIGHYTNFNGNNVFSSKMHVYFCFPTWATHFVIPNYETFLLFLELSVHCRPVDLHVHTCWYFSYACNIYTAYIVLHTAWPQLTKGKTVEGCVHCEKTVFHISTHISETITLKVLKKVKTLPKYNQFKKVGPTAYIILFSIYKFWKFSFVHSIGQGLKTAVSNSTELTFFTLLILVRVIVVVSYRWKTKSNLIWIAKSEKSFTQI